MIQREKTCQNQYQKDDMTSVCQNTPKFSIVIPVHNGSAHISHALDSAFSQNVPESDYEVLLIDDCSSDKTLEVAGSYIDHSNFRVFNTQRQSGPGVARNIGVANAKGEWIIFLDADDLLLPITVSELRKEIEANVATDHCLDAIGYNWTYVDENWSQKYSLPGLRKDYIHLTADRKTRIQRYLALQTDGSVIFTAIRRRLLLENNITFAPGYHEDVDYLFFVYWYAREYRYVNKVLYGKVQRQGSIVNSITMAHLIGFVRAWRAIGQFFVSLPCEQSLGFEKCYLQGFVAVIATRVREICRWSNSDNIASLCSCLYEQVNLAVMSLGLKMDFSSLTKYSQISRYFMDCMGDSSLSSHQKAIAIGEKTMEITAKSWSCIDLQHSLFLGPNQIRTCCKRFFHEHEMSGDVVLLDLGGSCASVVSTSSILLAKQQIISKINRGDKSPCDGCPFLEFKKWEALGDLNIRYLSLEYQTVCNLKCSYCSPAYYGGARATYDVSKFLKELVANGQLDQCQTVVWGGGEPVIAPGFSMLIKTIVDAVPKATHRVLTNSVVYSPVLAELLAADRVSITSSVDAGTAGTFKVVRGRDKLAEVMINLKKYIDLNPSRVTVKYIFTEQNTALEEVKSFVNLLNDYGLRECCFQISGDFKTDRIPLDWVVSISAMYGLLKRAGHRIVYLDDLLRQRLCGLHEGDVASIAGILEKLGLDWTLESCRDHPEVIIWGAGMQAKLLVENTIFFKHVKIAYFVDNTLSKIGTKYLGYEVCSPERLVHCDLPLTIAAVQGYPFIYKELLSLGLLESRVIRGLIL